MGTGLMEIGVHIRKFLIFSVKACYRSVWDHPLLVGMLFFLLLLYRFLPSLFGFLVSSAPVIVCTAVLLGTLLSLGQPNIPEVEEEVKRTHGISSLKTGGVVDDLVVEKDETFALENRVENRRDIDENAAEDVGLCEGARDREIKVEKDLVFSTTRAEEEVLVSRSVEIEEDEREIHSEIKGNEEGEVKDEKDVVDLSNGDHQKELEGLKVEIDKLSGEILATHLTNQSYKQITSHDASSDSESDRAESSSPDASMTDIIPMLDELHPLLDSEVPQPAHISVEDSDAESSSLSHESDDGSAELVEELENQEEEDEEEEEEEEEEEAQEEQEDGAKLVTWTEDDKKNVMDLGTSEIERNRRLENLIAKRMARKNQRIMAEKNLIDLDSTDSLQFTRDDLSFIHMQIPPISITRRNPFDLPYDSDETVGLPHIPGSAPSVLLPRRNPFDLPYDQVDGGGDSTGERLGHQEFVPVQQRESYFRRHESFAFGASSFSGEMKQEKHNIKWSPYFVPERMVSEGVGYAVFQRQSSEKSDSKMSSVLESESGSSIIDQEDHKELLERELHQETELVSPINPIPEAVERESQSSEEVDSVEIEQEHSEIDVAGIPEINLNVSDIIDETHQDIDAFEEVEEAVSREIDLSSPLSAVNTASVASAMGPDTREVYAKLEVVEENYSGSSSSSSSEGNEESTDEGLGNLNNVSDNSLKGSRESITQLALTDPDLLSRAATGVDDAGIEEPVYDSSPSALEKSLSYLASIEEDLLSVGKGTFNSTSSIASETPIDLLEAGLPPIPDQMDILPRDSSNGSIETGMGASNEGEWLENKFESRGVSETSEHEVVRVGILEVSQNYDDPIAPVMPKSVVEPVLNDSNSSLLETKLEGEDGLMFAKEALVPSSSFNQEIHFEGGPQSNVDEKINTSTPTQPSFDGDEEESQVIDEATIGSSDIDQELSFLQRKSSGQSEGENYVNKLVGESKDGDSSKVSPLTSSPDVAGLTGLRILEAMESMDSLSFSENKSELLEKEYIQNEQNSIVSRSSNDLEEATELQITMEESEEEAEGIKEIDEGLLSELDAVGDFSVGELRSHTSQTENQLRFDAQLEEATVADVGLIRETIPEVQVVEAKSLEDIDMENEFSSADSKLVGRGPIPMQSDSGLQDLEASSFGDIGSDFKKLQEVRSSEFVPDEESSEPIGSASSMQVLEASSLEDINLAFNQLQEVGSSVFILDKESSELICSDSGLQVLEASSLEDIESAFKQVSEVGSSESVMDKENSVPIGSAINVQVLGSSSLEDIDLSFKQLHEDESSEFVPDKENSKPIGSSSNLQVLEERSVEDVRLPLKQLSEGNPDNLLQPIESEDRSVEFEATEKQLEPIVHEVQSVEEIESAFKESVAQQVHTGAGLNAENTSHTIQAMADGSSSSTLVSKEKNEKAKSGKSGSSSSSSSSSSDSD